MAAATDAMGTPRELAHFLLLTPEEQAQAIKRLSNQGMTDTTIAAATRLSVEFVRRLLTEREPAG